MAAQRFSVQRPYKLRSMPPAEENHQSAPWPPPPDLESIRDLVRSADPEGHLAEGAPLDEYDPEAEAIFAFIAHLPTDQLTSINLLPIVERVWRDSFAHTNEAIATSRIALEGLAQQIARFFGPEAQPQTRQS
jgi:hypothetical protein